MNARSVAAIEVRDLSIGYPGHVVGREISVAAGAGDVLCLLGPNGSGKTTLFKTMLGLIPALAGEVEIGGAPLRELNRAAIARRVGYVPQAHAAHFPYLVIDMVTMGRTAHLGLFAQPTREDRDHARAALVSLGIEALAQKEYTRISGGQRQLVLIARALAQDTAAIVMDEPTASLDFGNQVLVLREVRRLAARGLAVVLSTHDPGHALATATKVVFLHDGRVLAAGTPANMLTSQRLADVYGVDVTLERVSGGQTVCVARLEDADTANARR